MNLLLPITNSKISASIYYAKPKETSLPIWTRKLNPLFSEKPYPKESISLINKDGLIAKDEDLAKTIIF